MKSKRIILTGGPHAGKTTVIQELKNQGFYVIDESAIEIIEALDMLVGDYENRIWRETHFTAFQALIGHRQKYFEDRIDETKELVFLDRGRIDNIAFATYFGHKITLENKALADSAHYDQVFLLDIIEPFKERKETGRIENREMAYGLQEQLLKTYHEYEFDVVRVPQMPLQERITFILNKARQVSVS